MGVFSLKSLRSDSIVLLLQKSNDFGTENLEDNVNCEEFNIKQKIGELPKISSKMRTYHKTLPTVLENDLIS